MGKVFISLICIVALTACQPSGNRPGWWLTGDAEAFPGDWRFADNFKEISIEVSTPYLLPHSVTIWCAQLNGNLYVAARAPETKNWPDWVADDPNVSLKFGDRLFDVKLVQLKDKIILASVARAYTAKYKLKNSSISGDNSRLWSVVPR